MSPEAIKEVVVVEGIHDRQKLESIYPGISCITTGGSAISEATISLIRTASETRGVILFLDPDHPGKQITQKIIAVVPGCKLAFLPAAKAKSPNMRKVGIEHASETAIRSSLGHLFSLEPGDVPGVSRLELSARHLSGEKDAAKRRFQICEALGLPRQNAKAFLKTVNMLGITIDEIDEVLR